MTLKELETCNILKLKKKFGPYNTKVLLNAIHSAVCSFFTDNIKVTQVSNVWKYNNNLFDLTVDRIKLILFFYNNEYQAGNIFFATIRNLQIFLRLPLSRNLLLEWRVHTCKILYPSKISHCWVTANNKFSCGTFIYHKTLWNTFNEGG